MLRELHLPAVAHLARLLAQEQERRKRVVPLVSEDLGYFFVLRLLMLRCFVVRLVLLFGLSVSVTKT